MRSGSAGGKAILLGEHFVVHGVPALAVPVGSRKVEVTVEPTPGNWNMEASLEAFMKALIEADGDDPATLTVHVSSDLPIGQGLGGSAALAVAYLRARGVEDRDQLHARAHQLERLAHGNPSGIDDTVVVWEAPILFTRGESPERLTRDENMALWIATTGQPGATRDAVTQVGQWRDTNPETFATLAAEAQLLTRDGRVVFERGNILKLGTLMNRNHAMLQQLGVSNDLLDTLVEAARDAGANGAKLTGAGLGGAIIAVARKGVDLTPALLAAGAKEVIEI